MRNGNAKLSTCSVRASTNDVKITEHIPLTSNEVSINPKK